MEAVPSGRCPVGERHGTGASTVKHVCEDGPAVSALPVRAQLGELPRRKAARDALECGRIVGKNRKCSHRRVNCVFCGGGGAGRTLSGVFIAGVNQGRYGVSSKHKPTYSVCLAAIGQFAPRTESSQTKYTICREVPSTKYQDEIIDPLVRR